MPRADHSRARAQDASSSGVVLVVDDQADIRTSFTDLLVREGFRVLTASGGAEALALVEREPIDLVLLDLVMPEVDGMTVLRTLGTRGRLPGLPVVVVTGHEDRTLRAGALLAGAIDFLTKPVDRFELGCKVRALTELKRLRSEAAVRVEQTAAAALLERIEQAVSGLPVVIYELRVSEVAREGSRGASVDETSYLAESWVIGDLNGLNGVTPEEFVRGNDWLTLVHPDDREGVERNLRQAIRGENVRYTHRFRLRVDGAYRWRLNAASFDAREGCLRGVLLNVDDQVAMEEQLLQAQKMEAVGELAGGVAHDFNNMLGVILSFGEFVREGLTEGDQRHSDIVEVLKAAERAAGLTRQLLTFSRRQVMEKRPTDLNASLAQLRKLLARTLGEHIEIDVTPSPRPAFVFIDPIQFDQVLLNLAVNARDAMPEGGRLRLLVDADLTGLGEARKVRITVADTGVGMDEATQRRIFEPFFTTKERGKGTGLGLATSFGIIEDAGGTIRVESQVGHGTTLTIELPACGELEGSATVYADIERHGHGEDVLVVEDDRALRKVTGRVLEAAGFRVHGAADGQEAIDLIDELGARLRVIVTDILMPGKSGFDVVDYAARVIPGVPVLLTSGYLDGSISRQGYEDRSILWKPVKPEDLVRAVAVAVAGQKPSAGQARDLIVWVDGDEENGQAVVGALAAAGYATKVAATVAAARQLIESGQAPWAIFCDRSLVDGIGFLRWAVKERPALRPRCFVLAVGVEGRVDEDAEFRVLGKPTDTQRLLSLLAASGQMRAPLVPRDIDGADGPTEKIMASTTSGLAPRKEKVLVIEDDPAMAEATARMLGDGGFDVVGASTLAAAKTHIARSDLSAVVSDVGLGDGTGLDLLAELRAADNKLPVVLVTGAVSVETAAQAVRLHASDYLAKPFRADDLVRVVREAVDTGRRSLLRAKLLASRFGGDEFVRDVAATEKAFAEALPLIYMDFQPIVRSADHSVFAYEALLRSKAPTLGSPLRLLAAAEVLGRVHDVGKAVRARVAATISEHSDRLETIFINVHPSELRADLLTEASDPLLKMSRRVVLEVTERAGLEAGAKLSDELRFIREHGYRLAVDDLGEGYAGLSSLVVLSPDFAKIDMSLVRGIDRAPLKRDIVAAILDLTHRSGIVVVAEGVETMDECDVLEALGVDLLQGYLFARPGPAFPAVFSRRAEDKRR